MTVHARGKHCPFFVRRATASHRSIPLIIVTMSTTLPQITPGWRCQRAHSCRRPPHAPSTRPASLSAPPWWPRRQHNSPGRSPDGTSAVGCLSGSVRRAFRNGCTAPLDYELDYDTRAPNIGLTVEVRSGCLNAVHKGPCLRVCANSTVESVGTTDASHIAQPLCCWYAVCTPAV